MKFFQSLFALTALSIASSAVGQASTFTYNQTITLNSNAIVSSGGVDEFTQSFSGNTPLTLKAGDVVTGTITFVNGPVLLEDSGSTAAVLFYFSQTTSAGPSTGGTAVTQFQGLSGTFGDSNPVTFSGIGGPFGLGMLPNGQADDFSFTSLTYTLNVNSVANGATQVSAPFAFSQFSLQGQDLAFGVTAASTPEPPALLLIVSGTAALALLRRRRQRMIARPASCPIAALPH